LGANYERLQADESEDVERFDFGVSLRRVMRCLASSPHSEGIANLVLGLIYLSIDSRECIDQKAGIFIHSLKTFKF
jgi:hypothetical protein